MKPNCIALRDLCNYYKNKQKKHETIKNGQVFFRIRSLMSFVSFSLEKRKNLMKNIVIE